MALRASLCFACAEAAPAAAQEAAPWLSVSVRGGVYFPAVGDQLLTLVNDLGMTREDFAPRMLGGELALRATGRVYLVAGAVSGSRTKTTTSESVDGPALQKTDLSILPSAFAGVRAAFSGPWAPFAGGKRSELSLSAGAASIRYRLVQEGQFADTEDGSRFAATFTSSGRVTQTFVAVSALVPVVPETGLRLQMQYGWGDAELRGDYAKLKTIDLSGPLITVGIERVLR